MSRRQGYTDDGRILHSAYVEKPLDVPNPDTGEMEPFVTDVYFDGSDAMTRQEFADECDINNLMKRYEVTGQLPQMYLGGQPQYMDVSEVPDLATALRVVDEARAAFMTLPARVRAEFENDPVKFVEYAQNPDNLGQMREWGLAPPEKAPEPPMRVEVVNPAEAEKAP